MKLLVVVDVCLYTHKVLKKLTLQVSDDTVLTEETAVDLLIEVGYIERDEDFEESVDFFRDHENIVSDNNSYTFVFEESTVMLSLYNC